MRDHSYLRSVAPNVLAPASFQEIFALPMDKLTYELEERGFNVWFTCEVDGVEYRLAAPKEGCTSPPIPTDTERGA